MRGREREKRMREERRVRESVRGDCRVMSVMKEQVMDGTKVGDWGKNHTGKWWRHLLGDLGRKTNQRVEKKEP